MILVFLAELLIENQFLKYLCQMKVPSNLISDIYSFYYKRLQEEYSSKESAILLKRLMGYYLNIKEFKIPQFIENKRVGESLMLKIHFGVKDLLQHKPLEYIIQRSNFYELEFFVNEHVLIPRPETEELVDLIWKTSAKYKNKPAILDIGTGSGCIAITLNKLIDAKTYALDISNLALDVARTNAKNLNADVTFVPMDFLDETQWKSLNLKFDIIISNPPYIRELEKSLMNENVLNFEPHKALFVRDKNPLIFYKKILDFSLEYLNSKGAIFVEINEFLGNETADIFRSNYSNVNIIKDLNGKDRFLWIS